ncbi:MAG TPA: hypothetical protein VMF89_13855 [Polyangiales bacterium]|nr:hypothetical protein [Polyangiales bacterium]
MSEKGNWPMTAFNKSWLAVGLLLAGALGACSSIVSVDRSKVDDKQYEVPPLPAPDAGSDDEDAG